MRISRKYEWFGILYEHDPESKKAIDEAFVKHNVPLKKRKRLVECNYSIIPANMNTECGIPGMCYRDFMDRFEEIDKTNPYDNDLTFDAVTSIEHYTRGEGKSMQLRLISQPAEMPYRIIGLIALENADNKTGYRIGKSWY